ncbi:MAG: right-handed parallel beta-helix repeat-containing protein, partial [Candidatus Hydrogenedentes bacterium]|nr:right-handed parallel beta-helix repeat-containing protein [Candidatus Hydrogenedentota bacterium]
EGVDINDPGTAPVIRDNECNDNAVNGVYLSRGAGGTIENNSCSRNGRDGIRVVFARTMPVLTLNHCEENKEDGIYFGSGCAGTAEDNECNGNSQHGVNVQGFDTAPHLSLNVCEKNQLDGIHFAREAGGIGSGNRALQNGRYGLARFGKGTDPTLDGNEVMNNQEANEVADENQQDPHELDRDEIGWLLDSRNFDRLEAIATRLRATKERTPSGEWQLRLFYKHIPRSSMQANILEKKEELLQVLQQWRDAKPDSLTPVVPLARAHVELAFESRGTGWAGEVTDEGRRGFRQHLATAATLLTQAEAPDVNDPAFYSVWLSVRGPQQTDRKEYFDLIKKGQAVEKGYYHLYYTAAHFLTPRWGGKPGDVEAVAADAADVTQAEEGESLYARVAAEILVEYGPEEFSRSGFDEDRLRQGFDDIERLFPGAPENLNRLTFFLCAAEDRDAAKTAFEKLGDRWEPEVWKKREKFDKWRDWAFGKVEMPPVPRPQLEQFPQSPESPLSSPAARRTLLIVLVVALFVVLIIFGAFIALLVHVSKKNA